MTAHKQQPNLTMTLNAAVPPMIVEGMTSNDMVVREGQNVSLMCKARGYPEPYVMWRREDGEEMLIGGEHGKHTYNALLHIRVHQQLPLTVTLLFFSFFFSLASPATINPVNVVDGELLHITKVSRLHMAAYLCVASNGVPPSISKRVHLRVQCEYQLGTKWKLCC